MRLAVMIPCYNEAVTISDVIGGFFEHMRGTPLFVGDNMSDDGTGDIAAREPGCSRVICCPIRGKGAAMRTMVGEVDADFYLFTDGDATYPVEYAPIMSDMASDKAMVIGRRALSGDNQTFMHKPGNMLVDYLVGRRYRARVYDVMSGYRVVPGDIARGFFKSWDGCGFEVETMLAMYALSRGLEFRYVDVSYYPRPEGSYSKIRTIRDGMSIIRSVLFARDV